MDFYLQLQEVVNKQIIQLKKLNYSIKEIKQLNILLAVEQIYFHQYQDFMNEVNQFVMHGMDVLKESDSKYNQFFKKYEKFIKYKNNLTTPSETEEKIKINPETTFLKG